MKGENDNGELCFSKGQTMHVDLLDPPTSTPAEATTRVEAGVCCQPESRWHCASHIWIMAACAAVTFILYWPTVGFDFVNWDDPWYVVENPLIRSWSPSNLYHVATDVAIKNYAPLTVLSFLFDYTCWALDPAGYHLTNVLLHTVNVLLVYVLLQRLTGSRFIGWATAALFAVHPLQVETVAWVSSRKGLLSGTFILASLIGWLRPDRRPKDEGYGLLFYVAALLSKALAIVVPPVVILYDVLVRKQSWSAAIARQVVPGVMAILLLLVTMTAQTTEIGGMRGHMELGKLQILAVDSVILWKYIGMLLFPQELCVLYDQPTTGIAAAVAVSVLGWIVVGATTYRLRNRFPLVGLGVASFFLFLLPVLNLFPITTLMNDRYLYLPSIAIFALLAGFIQQAAAHLVRLVDEHGNRRPIVVQSALSTIAAMCLIALYARETHQYLPVWRDGMSLWQYANSRVPQLPVVQIQLANTFHDAGNDTEAVRVLENALVNSQPDELDRRRILRKLDEWRPEYSSQGIGPSIAE